ncbi:GNAT family N-acetyltransferase [Paraneptunicella aestuarii]|uniref:GNAT family N-acetyltransferase n=1 Tax=Paraneptunicella aestuarii TaxID=2831148 RepID=UPI001E35B663|nr:GNAT family N-acetyltransferase [Paraneptunicella aestuarii]UAA39015.1 GNAT family N-acetyltransferase [Paraneptunicella aestuarii]
MEQEIYQFNDFAPKQLYKVLQLRSAVFVVEQTCYYQDMDDLDTLPETRHFMLMDGNELAGYSRILAPGASYSGYSSIGRILTSDKHRGQGLGHDVVSNSIQICKQLWPDYNIKIGAQSHLQEFYGAHGFKAIGEEYIEDGIPHIHMVRDGQG